MSAELSLLTYAEVAERLRISKAQVRRLVRAGRLKVARFGLSARADRVHPEDLAAFINASRQVQACPSPSAGIRGRSPSVMTVKSIVDLLETGPALRQVK